MKIDFKYVISIIVINSFVLSSCVKQSRKMKDVTGKYDVFQVVSGYNSISGSFVKDTHCTGEIVKLDKSQFSFSSECENYTYYYSIDEAGNLLNLKENDFSKGTFNWDNGVLTIEKSYQQTSAYTYTYIYAVKVEN